MKITHRYAIIVLCSLLLVGASVVAQEPDVPQARGHVVESGSFKVAPESVPTYMGVRSFFGSLLWPYDMGEFIYQQELARYDVDGGSAAAGIVTEAALEYRRVIFEQPNELAGLSGEQFERAQLRIIRRNVHDVRRIYRAMLRDLKEVGYPIERVELEVELRRQEADLFSLDGTPPDAEVWRVWHSFDQPDRQADSSGGER